MIILDNSVLSAFKRLDLLSHLEKLLTSAIISKEILNEYSLEWQKNIPNWIKILESDKSIQLKDIPISLSPADLSIIRLALKLNKPIATDDKLIRRYSKKLKIPITGSLGLLKTLYQKNLFKSKEEYQSYLNKLQEDVYISDDLMKWAMEDLR